MRLLWFVLVGFVVTLALAPYASAEPMGCDCDKMQHDSPTDMLARLGRGVVTSPITWGVTGVGLIAIGFWGWRAGWIPRAAVALGLWSRFEPEEIGEHPMRSRILDLLRFHPGGSTRRLAQLSGLNPGTLLYHLEVLHRFGLVSSQRTGRERAWYVTAGVPPDLRRLAALSVPARQKLFDLIEATPGVTQSELARVAGLSAATVHHHLQALGEAGLVAVKREGARVRCFSVSPAVPSITATDATFRPATPVG